MKKKILFLLLLVFIYGCGDFRPVPAKPQRTFREHALDAQADAIRHAVAVLYTQIRDCYPPGFSVTLLPLVNEFDVSEHIPAAVLVEQQLVAAFTEYGYGVLDRTRFELKSNFSSKKYFTCQEKFTTSLRIEGSYAVVDSDFLVAMRVVRNSDGMIIASEIAHMPYIRIQDPLSKESMRPQPSVNTKINRY